MTEFDVPCPTGIVSALTQGSGRTLLVVHPGGQDASMWDHVAGLLEADFRVVRIRRRIYDARHVAPRPHTRTSEVADILAVAVALPGPTVAVGHSSGAIGVLESALDPRARFDGAIAYEPPMPVDAPVAGEAQVRACAALAAGDPVEAMRIHLVDIVGLPPTMVGEMIGDASTRAALASFAPGQLADNEAIDGLGVGIARYVDLRVPVVLLMGELSPSHLLARSQALAEAIPDVRTVTMPGTGHGAHLDSPQLLADTVRNAAEGLFGR